MNTIAKTELPWFAVRVKSQCEKMVSDSLRYKGYEEFLPLYWSRRNWSDRVKVLQLPLFAGYLFARFDLADRNAILTTPGVSLIVGQGRMPLSVEPTEIENIRQAMSCGQTVQPWRGSQLATEFASKMAPCAESRASCCAVRAPVTLFWAFNYCSDR